MEQANPPAEFPSIPGLQPSIPSNGTIHEFPVVVKKEDPFLEDLENQKKRPREIMAPDLPKDQDIAVTAVRAPKRRKTQGTYWLGNW